VDFSGQVFGDEALRESEGSCLSGVARVIVGKDVEAGDIARGSNIFRLSADSAAQVGMPKSL